MKKILHIIFIPLFLIMLVTIISGCFGKEDRTKKIIVGTSSDPVTFDIHKTNDSATHNVAAQIYETLVLQDEELKFKPGLAKEWKKIDDKTYQFTLRSDVEFHNGAKMCAEDVVWSLKRAIESPAVSKLVNMIDPEKIKVIGNDIIEITTKEPFAPLLANLAHLGSSIMNKKAVESAGSNYGITSVVGTGPFKFSNWTLGDKVVLVRNDKYYKDKPLLEKIEFKTIVDSQSRLATLETGGIDIAYGLQNSDNILAEKNKELKVYKSPSLGVEYLGLNIKNNQYLQDKNMRKAIAHAINIPAIVNNLFKGTAKQVSGPINESVFGYNDEIKPYQYDINLAKEYLAKTSYPKGFLMKLYVSDSSSDRIKVAEAMKAQLALININVEINVEAWPAFLKRTGSGDAEMFLLGWTTITADGDYGLYPLFHSSNKGVSGNRTWYKNENVDKLLEKARKSLDLNERLAAYKEAQKIIHDELPWVFLYSKENITVTRNDISGFKQHPTLSHKLSTVSRIK